MIESRLPLLEKAILSTLGSTRKLILDSQVDYSKNNQQKITPSKKHNNEHESSTFPTKINSDKTNRNDQSIEPGRNQKITSNEAEKDEPPMQKSQLDVSTDKKTKQFAITENHGKSRRITENHGKSRNITE